jgi:hypothetical protein
MGLRAENGFRRAAVVARMARARKAADRRRLRARNFPANNRDSYTITGDALQFGARFAVRTTCYSFK